LLSPTKGKYRTKNKITYTIQLPIRPIHFQYREFQAVGRELSPSPAVAGYPVVTLTRASATAECPPRLPSL
jgi:hypothetical protein